MMYTSWWKKCITKLVIGVVNITFIGTVICLTDILFDTCIRTRNNSVTANAVLHTLSFLLDLELPRPFFLPIHSFDTSHHLIHIDSLFSNLIPITNCSDHYFNRHRDHHSLLPLLLSLILSVPHPCRPFKTIQIWINSSESSELFT